MPTTYALADEETKLLATKLIAKYYPDLAEVNVKIDFLFAFADPDGDKPAMEERGHRVMGQARIINLRDRVKGMGDAEITLDGDAWAAMPVERKEALIDHELYHFEIKRDKNGVVLMDDYNRPLLKNRNHDREMGWFDAIAKRHGTASAEIQQLKRLFDDSGQTYLPYIVPTAELTFLEENE